MADGESLVDRFSTGLIGLDPDDLLTDSCGLRAENESHRVTIGRCSCGIVGCGSVEVDIRRDHEQFIRTATDSSQQVRFPAAQYDAEVERALRDHTWETSERTASRLISQAVERSTHASAYLNGTYYLPWTDPSVTASSVRSGDAESLRYSVQFDHLAAAPSDSIHCTVHAERVGFRGYGMMLAEVGLPPGADVDRSSLDSAVADSGWDLQSYEVQLDRVVFYLWPRAGGTTFSFSLKARFPMKAQSSESVLYDYYNPQARASVPPAGFLIH